MRIRGRVGLGSTLPLCNGLPFRNYFLRATTLSCPTACGSAADAWLANGCGRRKIDYASYVQAMSSRYSRRTNMVLRASVALFVGCVAVAIAAIFIAGWEPIGVLGVKGP